MGSRRLSGFALAGVRTLDRGVGMTGLAMGEQSMATTALALCSPSRFVFGEIRLSYRIVRRESSSTVWQALCDKCHRATPPVELKPGRHSTEDQKRILTNLCKDSGLAKVGRRKHLCADCGASRAKTAQEPLFDVGAPNREPKRQRRRTA